MDVSAGPDLAICIPAYNRGPFIGATLQSIVDQGVPIEVIVSDNASSDETERVVRSFSAALHGLRYFRQPENRGADRNYLEAVGMATSKYCWLMGSDDLLAPGAITVLADALAMEPDVVLLDRENRAMDMAQSLGVERFVNGPARMFDCARPGVLADYLGSVTGIGGVFSYISAIVVRKEAWDRQVVREDLIGSAYIHAARLLDVLNGGGRLLYLGEPLVLNRMGNDSFATGGYARRRRLDFNYVEIANRVFQAEPELRDRLIRVLERQYFTLWQILSDARYAAMEGASALSTLKSGYALMKGRPGFRFKMWVMRVVPVGVLGLVRRALRVLRKATR